METAAGTNAFQREEDTGVEIDIARKSCLAQNPEGAGGRNGVGLGGVEIAGAVHVRIGRSGRLHVRQDRSLQIVEDARCAGGQRVVSARYREDHHVRPGRDARCDEAAGLNR